MNKLILNTFNMLIKKATTSGEKINIFKIRHYKKAIKIIEDDGDNDSENTLSYYKNLFQINGIKNPKKLLNKINELMETGKLEELADFDNDAAEKKIKILTSFTDIYGVGPKKAAVLYDSGYKSIEDLREQIKKEPKNSKDTLNEKQKIGLKYYEDLLERIPRNEINEYNKIFTKITSKLDITMNIAGSYRRGALNSGDIDLLITDTKNKYKFGEALKLVIAELRKTKVLKAVLANGKKKFMGVTSIMSKKHRHLDIIETTKEDYPFALLYFTGSQLTNIQMRQKAVLLGYSLNEYNITYKGTKDIIKPKDIKKILKKTIISSEKDIFKLLDMPYKKPTER